MSAKRRADVGKESEATAKDTYSLRVYLIGIVEKKLAITRRVYESNRGDTQIQIFTARKTFDINILITPSIHNAIYPVDVRIFTWERCEFGDGRIWI